MDVLIPVLTNAVGSASVPLAIPNDTTLRGVLFYNQFLVVDPLANSLGLVLTHGMEATVGG